MYRPERIGIFPRARGFQVGLVNHLPGYQIALVHVFAILRFFPMGRGLSKDVEKLYRNSPKSLIAALVQSQPLSKEDLEEIRALLDREEE